MIEYRKEFDAYIRDCKDPAKKAAAVKAKAKLEGYRQDKSKDGGGLISPRKAYKAEVLDNPDGMKLESGKTYKAKLVESDDPAPEVYHDRRRMLTEKIETATVPVVFAKQHEERSKRIECVKHELKILSIHSQIKPLTKEQQMRRADLVIELRGLGAI